MRNRHRIIWVWVLILTLLLSLFTPQEIENVKAKEKVVYQLDSQKKDEQGVIYTLNSSAQTASVIGQNLLDANMEVQIPDEVISSDGIHYTVVSVENAFASCANISKLYLSDSVESFTFRAIIGSACKEIYFGKNVKEIEYQNTNVKNLEYMEVDEGNPYFATDEYGVLYDIGKISIIKCPSKIRATKYTAPSTVKTVCANAFCSCDIEHLDLSHVLYVENAAFNYSTVKTLDLARCIQTSGAILYYATRLELVRMNKTVELSENWAGWANTKVAINSADFSYEIGTRNTNIDRRKNVELMIVGRDESCLNTGVYANVKRLVIQPGKRELNSGYIYSTLKKIYIPSSITKIASDALSYFNGTVYGEAGSAIGTFCKTQNKTFVAHGEADHVWKSGILHQSGEMRLEADVCEICNMAQNFKTLVGDEEEEKEYTVQDVVYEVDADKKDSQGLVYSYYGGVWCAGNGVLEDAYAGESVTIPDYIVVDGKKEAVVSIRNNAFGTLTKRIKISHNIKKIEDKALKNASNLDAIEVDEANANFSSENGALYDASKVKLLRAPNVESFSITNDSTTVVADYAFYNNNKLVNVEFGEKVVEIGQSSFENTSIQQLYIPYIKTLSSRTFAGCTKLKWVVGGVLNKHQYLDHTFGDCTRLEAVYFTKISSVLSNTFNNCYSLKVLIMEKTDTETIRNTFASGSSLELLILPDGLNEIIRYSPERDTLTAQVNLKELYVPESVQTINLSQLNAENLEVYGKEGSAAQGVASSLGYTFIAERDHEHSWNTKYLYRANKLKISAKKCTECGKLENIEVFVGEDEDESEPTVKPTSTPEVTVTPTEEPTAIPTVEPTSTPEETVTPTVTPTVEPTSTPEETVTPTVEPTSTPEETVTPTVEPTSTPEVTVTPTVEPTSAPEVTVSPVLPPVESILPTVEPTVEPTSTPEETVTPTVEPTSTPEETVTPTVEPTSTPEETVTPTVEPTSTPEETVTPTVEPTSTPEETAIPTVEPTVEPASTPEVTATPTVAPTSTPEETAIPTVEPTVESTSTPEETAIPTVEPTSTPEETAIPTVEPTVESTSTPEVTATPTVAPTSTPDVVSVAIVKTKNRTLLACPIIKVSKCKQAKIHFLKIVLKKYKGKYAEVFIKKKKGKYNKIGGKAFVIKKYKGIFKVLFNKKKQTLYIRVRTYQIVNRKKVYSAYSKVTKIRT